MINNSLSNLFPTLYSDDSDLLIIIDGFINPTISMTLMSIIKGLGQETTTIVPYGAGDWKRDPEQMTDSTTADKADYRVNRGRLIELINNHPANKVVIMSDKADAFVIYDTLHPLGLEYLSKIYPDYLELAQELGADVAGDVWSPALKTLFHKCYMKLTKDARKVIKEKKPADFVVNNFESKKQNNLSVNHGNYFRIPECGDKIIVPTHSPAWLFKVLEERKYNRDGSYKTIKVAHLSPERVEIVTRDFERVINFTSVHKPEWEIVDLETLAFRDGATVFIDLETRPNTLYKHMGKEAALDPRLSSIMLLVFATDNSDIVGIVPNPSKADLGMFYQKMVDANATMVWHNAVFDLTHISYNSGFLWELPHHDTMAMAYLEGNESGLGLKHLATMYTDLAGSHTWGSFESYEYAAEDILATKALYARFQENSTFNTPAYRLVTDLSYGLVQLHLNGVFVDLDEIDRQVAQLDAVVEKSKQDVLDSFQEISGYEAVHELNLSSNPTIGWMLEQSGAPLEIKTKGGAWSVTEKILENMAMKVVWVEKLLTYKTTLKLADTFYKPYKEGALRHPDYKGFVFPWYNSMFTATSRLSCERPNIQQAPSFGVFKRIFCSRWEGGWFGNVDLAGAELKIAALVSQDQKMIETLASTDFHKYCASIVFNKPFAEVTKEERGMTKSVVFGLIYGGGARGLAGRIGADVKQVEYVFKVISETFPTLWAWLQETKQQVLVDKFTQSPLGQKRRFVEELALNMGHSVQREGVNTPIQGTASQLNTYITLNMMKLFREHGCRSLLVSLVHDSNQVDIHPDELELVPQLVQQAFVDVRETEFGWLPNYEKVEFTGEFNIGRTWLSADGKDKEEEPIVSYMCSTWEKK